MSVSNETMDRILERMTDEQISSHVTKCWIELGNRKRNRKAKSEPEDDDIQIMDEDDLHDDGPDPVDQMREELQDPSHWRSSLVEDE